MAGTSPAMTDDKTGSRRSSGSTATRLLGAIGLRGRGNVIDDSRLELLFDLGEVIRLRLEVARMRPLEACLQGPADLPIGVAQVVVDCRVFRLELNGALQIAHRF